MSKDLHWISPCVHIRAQTWLDQPDVKEWLLRKNNGAAVFIGTDVFTTYDHGEGPACPHMSKEEDPDAMPLWLWQAIVRVLKDLHLDDEYVVIRLAYEE